MELGYGSDSSLLRRHTQDHEFNSQHCKNRVWWYTPFILALGSLRQEDQRLKVSLDYIESFRLAWDKQDPVLPLRENF